LPWLSTGPPKSGRAPGRDLRLRSLCDYVIAVRFIFPHEKATAMNARNRYGRGICAFAAHLAYIHLHGRPRDCCQLKVAWLMFFKVYRIFLIAQPTITRNILHKKGSAPSSFNFRCSRSHASEEKLSRGGGGFVTNITYFCNKKGI
jgi:hypothetical protein